MRKIVLFKVRYGFGAAEQRIKWPRESINSAESLSAV
jgi:hypothetical protein